ncbi:hypothetical protein AVEN_128273-1 [Araneus ventricosus]|uniref:Uncharacterized protein n=1 Tax=Araneus ventricosus TaxID=182803 RepID=A0A4Y2FSD3_ARAVE|nr:hypothetical protein AVEN_128273-1 [Araneus ventricosus]
MPKFGSTEIIILKLINLVHSLRFSISYSEICKYETYVTISTSSEVQDNEFVQFVSDNSDHNTPTVDGLGTFQVMGGVQCATPFSADQTSSCIPQSEIIPTNDKCCREVRIHPNCYSRLIQEPCIESPGNGSRPLTDIVAVACRNRNYIPLDWMAGPKSVDESHTIWSGFMDIAAGKRCYKKSAVIPLPFVNLQPSNATSINTCLHFAEECT